MAKIQCPKCQAKELYKLGNGKMRCSQCHYDFLSHRLPMYLTREQWREIITWFLLEQSSQNIGSGTSIERKRVFRALTLIRRALTQDVPDIFSGTVEVMRHIWEASGRISGRPSEIQEQNEAEAQRNKQFFESCVAMGPSGMRL